DATPLKIQKKNLSSYSPTTGTRQISPFASPVSHNTQSLTSGPSNGGREPNGSESGSSRRGQPQTEKDELMELQSKVKSSVDKILKIRKNLTSLQALEGSGELQKILGVPDSSYTLAAEVRRSQVLMGQAEELQLLEKKPEKLP
ncbi:CENPR protein, partial [Rhinopomastus cyanomelas]|nr:CENPR protein [Rhinopomastus cyanomelas]